MKLITLILGCWLSMTVQASEATPQEEQIARHWLQLVDQGDYLHSWEETDHKFQQRINARDWVSIVEYARDPLGKPVSRKLIQAQRHSTSSNEQFVKLDFKTDFENRHIATERITLHQRDGNWQISKYLIH